MLIEKFLSMTLMKHVPAYQKYNDNDVRGLIMMIQARLIDEKRKEDEQIDDDDNEKEKKKKEEEGEGGES